MEMARGPEDGNFIFPQSFFRGRNGRRAFAVNSFFNRRSLELFCGRMIPGATSLLSLGGRAGLSAFLPN